MTKTFTAVVPAPLHKLWLAGDDAIWYKCRRIIMFVILNFGHWDLFEICFLVLEILYIQSIPRRII